MECGCEGEMEGAGEALSSLLSLPPSSSPDCEGKGEAEGGDEGKV